MFRPVAHDEAWVADALFLFCATGADACLLYLHANATDCGAMLPTYAAFSRRLDVHVLAGEYSGYGPATKSATPRNVEADAEALYDEALRLGLCGRSVDTVWPVRRERTSLLS